jgi:hypothetical protein
VKLLGVQPASSRLEKWSFLSAAALMAAEITLISLWYHALIRNLSLAVGLLFIILFAVLLASYLITRAMDQMQLRMGIRRFIILCWLLVTVFGTLKIVIFSATGIALIDLVSLPVRFIILPNIDGTPFFHMLLIILLVSRGVNMAGSPVTLRGIQVSFQLWLILLLIYGIAFAPAHPREAAFGLYSFLFFGLISMSTARISGLNEMGGSRVPRFGRAWLLSIFLSGLAVVGLAVSAGWLASSSIVALVIRVFIFVLTILTALVMLIFTPVIMLLANFIPRIIELIDNLASTLQSLRLPKFLEDLTIEIGQVLEKTIPFIFAGRGLILLAAVSLIIFVIMMGLRLRKTDQQINEEDDTSSADSGQEGIQWPKWLRKLIQDGKHFGLRSPARMLAAARIRSIYRQLMALSQKMGAERPASVTPLEFQPRLEELFPEERSQVGRITGAYIKVRYGEYPETMQEVESVQAAWESVRRSGKKKLSHK